VFQLYSVTVGRYAVIWHTAGADILQILKWEMKHKGY